MPTVKGPSEGQIAFFTYHYALCTLQVSLLTVTPITVTQ